MKHSSICGCEECVIQDLTERLAQAERRHQDKLEEMGAALAQSERERSTARQMEAMWRDREHTAAAERDEWKTKADTWEWELKNRDGGTVERLRAERDAALARVKEFEDRHERNLLMRKHEQTMDVAGFSPWRMGRDELIHRWEQAESKAALLETAMEEETRHTKEVEEIFNRKYGTLNDKFEDVCAELDAALEKAEAAEKRAEAISTENCSARQQIFDMRARIEALAERWGHHEHGYALRALLQPPKAESALDVLSWVENRFHGEDGEVKARFAKLRKLLEEKK